MAAFAMGALTAWLAGLSLWRRRIAGPVASAIASKCLKARPGTVAKASEACMLLAELEAAAAVVEGVTKALTDKVPKVVVAALDILARVVGCARRAGCGEGKEGERGSGLSPLPGRLEYTITGLLSRERGSGRGVRPSSEARSPPRRRPPPTRPCPRRAFGTKVVDAKSVVKALPPAFGHSNAGVRDAAKGVCVALAAYLGAGVVEGTLLDKMPAAMRKDVEGLIAELPPGAGRGASFSFCFWPGRGREGCCHFTAVVWRGLEGCGWGGVGSWALRVQQAGVAELLCFREMVAADDSEVCVRGVEYPPPAPRARLQARSTRSGSRGGRPRHGPPPAGMTPRTWMWTGRPPPRGSPRRRWRRCGAGRRPAAGVLRRGLRRWPDLGLSLRCQPVVSGRAPRVQSVN